MNTKEIIKALRTTPSRSKKALLDEAADKLDELQKEKEALVADLQKLPDTDEDADIYSDILEINSEITSHRLERKR